MNNIKRNLLRHWHSATQEDKAAGATWYQRAREVIGQLAEQHNVTTTKVAGVVAATSPRMHWCRNLAVTRDILAGRRPVGVFLANRVKAARILLGAKPLVVLGGNKVRAFYRALTGQNAAVIDVWMLRACGLHPATRLRNPLYDTVARTLGALAHQLGVRIPELQATIWVVVRGSAT